MLPVEAHQKTGTRTFKTGFSSWPKTRNEAQISLQNGHIHYGPALTEQRKWTTATPRTKRDRAENVGWRHRRVKEQTLYDSLLQNSKRVKSLDSVSHQGWRLLLGGGSGEQPEAWEALGCCALGVLPLWRFMTSHLGCVHFSVWVCSLRTFKHLTDI